MSRNAAALVRGFAGIVAALCLVAPTMASEPETDSSPAVVAAASGAFLQSSSGDDVVVEPGADAGRSSEVARVLPPLQWSETWEERAYVVTIADGAATGDVSPAKAASVTAAAGDYWVREARGAISGFMVAETKTLTLEGSCSYAYDEVWPIAEGLYPDVSFAEQGNHLVVFAPAECNAGAAGTVGRFGARGGRVYLSGASTTNVIHELGHNLGLRHANVTYVEADGTTTWLEYHGCFGPQGVTGYDEYAIGTLDAGYRHYLGLAGDSEALVSIDDGAPASTVVTLDATHADDGTTAVLLDDPATERQYFVEYRSGRGTDANTIYADPASTFGLLVGDYDTVTLRPGVVISEFRSDLHLDYFATRSSAGSWRIAYEPGAPYVDASGRFAFRVLAMTGTSATVEIFTGSTGGLETNTSLYSTTQVTTAGPNSKSTIYVSRSDGVLATGDVRISLDGSPVTTVSLVGGRAHYAPAKGVTPGAHTLVATYLGAEAAPRSTASVTLTVNPTPKISATAKTVPYGAAQKLNVALTGPTVATGNVVVKQGTKKWTLALVGGKASLTLPKWSPGTRTLSVTYAGSSSLRSASATTSAKVTKATPGATVTAKTSVRAGRQATFAVRVKAPGAVAESGTVTLLVNGSKVSTTTKLRASGDAYIATVRTASLPKGRVTLRYSGNAKVKPLTQRTRHVAD